jgi:hypothetical protein
MHKFSHAFDMKLTLIWDIFVGVHGIHMDSIHFMLENSFFAKII